MGSVVNMDEIGAVDVGDAYDTDEPDFEIAVDDEQPDRFLQLVAIDDMAIRTENRPPELVLIEGGHQTHDTNCN